MTKFYNYGVSTDCGEPTYWVKVKVGNDSEVKTIIEHKVYEEIVSLQREYWRQEKKESRHTWHYELMSEGDLLKIHRSKDPEQLLVESYEKTVIANAVFRIPEIQRRRFLMHYLNGFTLDQIAEAEGCSNRAISYSLTLAKRNLQKLLVGEFDY